MNKNEDEEETEDRIKMEEEDEDEESEGEQVRKAGFYDIPIYMLTWFIYQNRS